MGEEKNGKAKITIEVEVNEALMAAAKEWRPRMGWMGPWGGMGPWKSHGMMGGQMPWGMPGGMGSGMQCPACGEPMIKPSKEQVLEILQRRKEKLEAVLEHINMEINKLNEAKTEEKSP
jgi:hypothetical protein